MARWLITGATGFLGRHLLDLTADELQPARSNRGRGFRPGQAHSAGLARGPFCPGRPRQPRRASDGARDDRA